jgi:hypothetical protein
MKDGTVRVTKVRPSYNIHRSNIDVDLAKLKMYRASMAINGFVVNAGEILRGDEAKKFIAGLVHSKVNKLSALPVSKRDRLIANERIAIAINNGFNHKLQWSTLIGKACEAFTICKKNAKSAPDAQAYPNETYIACFVSMIERIGLKRFELILRDADVRTAGDRSCIDNAILS